MQKAISTIILALTLASLGLAFATSAGAASTRSSQPTWLPNVWWRLATCETGANWQHDSGTFQGAFGIYKGTWDTYRLPGYPTEAHRATPKQQYRVALRIAANHTMYAWGCYRVIR